MIRVLEASIPVFIPLPEFIFHNFSHHIKPNIHENFTFYSHQRGYKMLLVVYPYGLGLYQGTHVSVGVCILEGEYDGSLHWPLSAEVTIELISQQIDSPYTSSTRLSLHDVDCVTEEESCGEVRYAHNFITHDELKANRYYRHNDCLMFRITNVVMFTH